MALLNLGLLAADEGDAERARTLCGEALSIRLAHANEAGAAIVRHALADLARTAGDRFAATALYGENLAVYRGLGDPAGIADAIVGITISATTGAQLEPAIRLLAATADVREETGAAIHASLRADYDALVARARTDLGEAVFAAVWATGGEASLEQAADAAAELVDAAAAARAAKSDEPSNAAPYGLTPRELDVLRLIAEGYSDRQIGEDLFVSRRTATTHVTNIFNKLGVDTRAAAAACAVRLGLI